MHSLALLLPLALAAPAPSPDDLPYPRAEAPAGEATRKATIPFEKYRLSNGLEVILHVDRSTPVVAVNVWYHVGSKNEKPGRTGFAHLFEHMMFQGSKHWDDDFFKPIQEAGGSANGSTNTDRTNYWENVPASFLERALWLESDRMGFLLDAMTEKRLDNQRDVVRNERRQRYENEPYGLAREALFEAAFPEGHPYSWLTIGSMEDLGAASLDDVKDFFRRYYNPSNATLALAGDFDPAEARRLVEKWFGALPPGPPVTRWDAWVPRLESERVVVMQDRVQLPRVYLLWHTTPAFTADEPALEVLARILGGGKSSRLFDALVYTKRLAEDASASHDAREIAGTFHVVATARPGERPDSLVAAIDAEIARLASEGPTAAEVGRALNGFEAESVRSLERVGGFGGVADRLNFYNHYLGDPGYHDEDLARHLAVRPEDVRRAARAYLGAARVRLVVEPLPPLSASRSETATSVDRTASPAPGASAQVALPGAWRATLANGLRVVFVPRHDLPVVEANLVLDAGSSSDPAAAPGLASFVAEMLDEGTSTREALDIARELDALGSSLSASVDADSASVTLSTLAKHADAAFDVLADVVTRPSFPQEELDRVRAQALARLLQEKDRPGALAGRAVATAVFGDRHPYGHVASGTPRAVEAMTREDVRRFWSERYRPGRATLVVVGDLTPERARALAERALGGWAPGAAASAPIPPPAPGAGRRIYLVDRPGAAQSVVSVAQAGLPMSSPDHFPALVLNSALGGMFTSRLNMNLREEKGYTYGARSSFDFRRAPGPFTAGASVQTRTTGPAVVEILRELDQVRGTRPIAAAELAFAKNALVRGFPAGFETAGQIAGRLRDVVVHGLGDDWFSRWVARVEAVTVEDVARVARSAIRPADLSIVVVGDASAVTKDLEAIAPVVLVDPMAGEPR